MSKSDVSVSSRSPITIAGWNLANGTVAYTK